MLKDLDISVVDEDKHQASRRLLEAENRSLEEKLARLEAERVRLKAERAHLEAEMHQLEAQNADLEARYREADLLKRTFETENQYLLRRIGELVSQLAKATQREEQLSLAHEVRRLQERLGDRNAELFGSSRSERRGSKSGDANKGSKKKNKARGHGPRPQPKLPTDEQIHLLDPADEICPKCGCGLHPWKHHFEESEEVTTIVRTYKLVTHKRQKYHCGGCGHIDTALGPPKVIPGGRYSAEFTAQVAVDKYSDHLPLNRQVERMRRAGLTVTRSTLWDQLYAAFILLLPTLALLHKLILSAELVYADETSWRLMKKGQGSRKWWVWMVRTATAVYYLISPTRGMDAGRQLLQDYAGIVMADGYQVYISLEKEKTRKGGVQTVITDKGEVIEVWTPDFTLAGCWSHARRPFFKARKNYPSAIEALDLIDELFSIERQAATEANGDPVALLAIRRRMRAAESREVTLRLDAWRRAERVVPKTQLADAIGYLNNRWAHLLRFLDDPRIPLTNNLAEQAERNPVLGRKNHYGSRSEDGASVAGLFYSLTATCKALGLNAEAYLSEALRRTAQSPGATFLPQEFAQELEDARKAHAAKDLLAPSG